MVNSRRDFVKTMSLTGMVTLATPEFLLSSKSLKQNNKNEKRLTILFQGDSITDGNRTRNNDWNHVMGHGYAYLVASRLWYDEIDKNLMFYNRGISGNKVRDLEARWQVDTLDLMPDVLSILIGVNDVNAVVDDPGSQTIEEFEATYKRILDQTREALPETRIILCEPFILPVGQVAKNFDVWQEEIQKRQQVVRKLANAYGALFIEFQNPFNDACENAPANYWIWDGVHPMPAGHELMARHWIEKVKNELSLF